MLPNPETCTLTPILHVEPTGVGWKKVSGEWERQAYYQQTILHRNWITYCYLVWRCKEISWKPRSNRTRYLHYDEVRDSYLLEFIENRRRSIKNPPESSIDGYMIEGFFHGVEVAVRFEAEKRLHHVYGWGDTPQDERMKA